jgi:hypothetical protein
MPKDLQELIERLRNPSWAGREECVKAIVGHGFSALGHLIGMIESERFNPPARLSALSAITLIIIEEIKAGPFVDEAGRFTSIRPMFLDHANEIFSFLEDEDMDVRRQASITLGLLGDRRVIEYLIDFLKDSNDSFKSIAILSLKKMTMQEFDDAEEWQDWWDRIKKNLP